MSDRSGRRRASTYTRGAHLTLLVSLTACTGALGGAAPVALWLLLPLSLGALTLAALGAHREGLSLRVPPLAAVGLVATAVVALQLLPLPPSLLGLLSPRTEELRLFALLPLGIDGWRPLSVDVPSTARALVLQLSLVLSLLAAAHVSRFRETRRALAAGVAGVGGLVAGIAVLHLLVDARALFGFYRFEKAAPALLTPFGNPNHLAGFLTVTALCALGLALSAKEGARKLLWALLFVGQGAVVALSLSRGGIAFFLVAALLYAVLVLREKTEAAPAVGWIAGAVLVVGSVAGYLAWEPLAGELRTVSSLEGLRASKLELWPMIGRAALEHPWAGLGRGAFELGFSRFHTQWADVVFTHAENLPLQLAVELGLVPAALLLIAGLFALWRALRRRSLDRLELALVAAVTGAVLHDLFDFALELSPTSLAVALLLGVLCRSEEAPAQSGVKVLRLGRVPALAAVALSAFAGLWALWAGRHHHADAEASLLATVREGKLSSEALLAEARPLLARHPADYYLYGLLAQAHSTGPHADPVNALAFANRALFLRPLDGDAHKAAARALLRLGRRGQAMLELRLAREAGAQGVLEEIVRHARTTDELWAAVPKGPGEVLQLAHALNGAGRFEQARELLGRARTELRQHERAVGLWTVGSAWALQAGEVDEALALVEEAQTIDPESPAVPRTRADILARSGRRKDAIEVLELALRRHVGDFELSLTLHAHLLQDGQRHRAREALTRAAPFVGGHADRARFLRAEGQLLSAEGKKGKALQAFLSASRLSPEDPGLHYETAQLYEALQRPHEAIRAVREAARLEGRMRPDIEAWLTRLEARDRELSELRARRQVLGRDAVPDEILFGFGE